MKKLLFIVPLLALLLTGCSKCVDSHQEKSVCDYVQSCAYKFQYIPNGGMCLFVGQTFVTGQYECEKTVCDKYNN